MKKILSLVIALILMLVLAMPVMAGVTPYYDINSDLDCEPDGKVTLDDYAVLYDLYETGGYDRQWDADFDNDIDNHDLLYFAATRFAVDDLDVIQANIKTNDYTTLTWHDPWVYDTDDSCYIEEKEVLQAVRDYYAGLIIKEQVAQVRELWENNTKNPACELPPEDDWSCLLYSVDSTHVRDFIGKDSSTKGWLHIHEHPYSSTYSCQRFAIDTALAAYKGLGYGVLLYAQNDKHAYNIFCLDTSDWENLNNWLIIDPQTGAFYNPTSVGSKYQTIRICFPDYRSGEEITWRILNVDYANETVFYGTTTRRSIIYYLEEYCPASFDKFLGQGHD